MMAMRSRHPSGCGCLPPVIAKTGQVLQVTSCPVCLAWERPRRFPQLDLFESGGVDTVVRGSEPSDPIEVNGPGEELPDLPF